MLINAIASTTLGLIPADYHDAKQRWLAENMPRKK
jgi:hypothetical protein